MSFVEHYSNYVYSNLFYNQVRKATIFNGYFKCTFAVVAWYANAMLHWILYISIENASWNLSTRYVFFWRKSLKLWRNYSTVSFRDLDLRYRDDFFWVDFDNFEESSIFCGSWGSIKNWLELISEPPLADLALLNPETHCRKNSLVFSSHSNI